jgi:hypothetical protein
VVARSPSKSPVHGLTNEFFVSQTVNVDGENVRFFHAIKSGVHRVFIDHPW